MNRKISNKSILNFSFLLAISFSVFAQEVEKRIYNSDAITGFYSRLSLLESNSIDKVRITHIGDSHIQADFFTGAMRTHFQNRYGNAGLGFTFPYKLAKTNGTSLVKITSNVDFKAVKNVKAKSGEPVGLSGYSCQSKYPNTALKIRTKPEYAFHYFTLLTDTPDDFYFSTYQSKRSFDQLIPQHSVKIHRVKKGEYLGAIASKYHVSLAKIRKLNHIKRDLIYPKQKLRIPIDKVVKVKVNPKDFKYLDFETKDLNKLTYHTDKLKDNIYIFNNNFNKKANLFGFILEKDTHGILYNTIGVNGAKSGDYLKFPLFFEQLPYLESDLIIISTGTNESFDKQEPKVFIEHFLNFIDKIRANSPGIEILVTTPPPSLVKRRYKNVLIKAYRLEILNNMEAYNYAVWDLYTAIGGDEQVRNNYKKGWIARDRIHFTKEGYAKQAQLFFKDLIDEKQ